MRRFLFVWGLALALLWVPLTVIAQADPDPTPVPEQGQSEESPVSTDSNGEVPIPKVHVVQAGEALAYIAELYGTTVEALQIANNIVDPSLLFVGAELIVPGAAGDEVPTVYTIQIGDTPEGIATQFNTSVEAIAIINNFVRSDILPAGEQISLISRTGSGVPRPVTGLPHMVQAGENIYTLSLKYGISIDEIAEINNLSKPIYLFPGQRLRIPSEKVFNNLPGEWVDISLSALPAIQGDTLTVYVENLQAGMAQGEIIRADGITLPLNFLPSGDGHEALVGLDAFAPSGEYLIRLGGEGVSRPWLPFEQRFSIGSGNYGLQSIVVSGERVALLAPEIRSEEDAFLNTIFTASDGGPKWDQIFQLPVSGTITAGYGDSRSYNGGPVTVFHSGIDFAGTIGTPIVSPAAGTVVYSDNLTLRGNSLIVDHGMGVMTAYYHLSQIDVEVGDQVGRGQKIAEGGDTGLSTGPHLHWDVRVWGQAINPLPWLNQQFP
ncbi:MAG: LysM peptidoglycan-binding domain-containing protein [Chloroflexota bacterium]